MSNAPKDAITGLLQSVSTPLGRNDLGRLARMHSWCQVLTEAASPAGGAVVSAALGGVAQALLTLLERIILDEATQPDLGIQLIPDVVRTIERLSQGQPADAGTVVAQIQEAIDGPPRNAPIARSAPPPTVAKPDPPPVAAAPVDVVEAAPEDDRYVSEPLTLDLTEREHLDGFLDESTEHMDTIEAGLLEVERDQTDMAKINELFRPFHTIKGIAGFLNLRDINRLTHEIETILDLGRKGVLSITATTVDLIFGAVDLLKSQLQAIREYLAAPTGGPCPQPEVAAMIHQLRRVARGQSLTAPAAPVPRAKLGEVLVTTGTITDPELESALETQANDPPPPRKLGQILVDQQSATASQVDRALVQQAATKPITDNSIRVDTRKLDMLVDAVGELVIAQSMVSLAEAPLANEKLHRNVSQANKIVRDVQEISMAMRMVPIGPTFQKMRRLVRDVSRKAEKLVELQINGEETELDKNVIQQISDPLVHMVRNAVDHGIETAAQRRAAGKPEAGQVTLNAFHQGDSIVIEIRDDGRGLDRHKLLAKGLERGLVTPEDQLTDPQVFNLIFASGFSTAEQVTDISGRGVGMDVVRRNVEQLRGKIEIQSVLGRGSTFQIRLPLTLAIIDGMLVRVGGERMIIPTILIEQSLRPEASQITTVQQRGAMLQVRGELCPLIQLGALFGYTQPIDPCGSLVVIVQCETGKVALVVDELIGQQQVVIKTLGDRFKRVRGVSGAAILGDGHVGVILEPSGILALFNRHGSATFARRACAAQPSPSAPSDEEPQPSTNGASTLAEAVAAPIGV